MSQRTAEKQVTVEDINELLGPAVMDICQVLGKPKDALAFAKALTSITANEALSALMGYRALPDEALAAIGRNPNKVAGLQKAAHEYMAGRQLETRRREVDSLDMGVVLDHFRGQLERMGLPFALHDALRANPDPRQAMAALVVGQGTVPDDIRKAYQDARGLRPQVLSAAQSSWQQHTALNV